MVVIGKPRGLNKGERYPCSVNQIKARFARTDIHIGIGMNRDFAFDNLAKKRPLIRGRVIASLQVNRRESRLGDAGILCVYPIREERYGEGEAREFAAVWLGELYARYAEWSGGPTLINSVQCLLVEYDEGSFRRHVFSFQ